MNTHLKSYISAFIVFFLVLVSLSLYSQVDAGGVPRSFQLKGNEKAMLRFMDIPAPERNMLEADDMEDARKEKPYCVGIEVPVSISSGMQGTWTDVPGGRIWRLAVKCAGAQALGLNFENLFLPDGTDLFVYTTDHQYIIGAVTPGLYPGKRSFATRPLKGDEIVIEYFEPLNATKNTIEISGLSYQYRGYEIVDNESASGSLGSCEVNVNCSEGDDWQNQKRGVVKIYTKVGNRYYYCSGVLLNNTAQDFAGLLLTASHCNRDYSGVIASADDLSQWVFYFNYESPGCITTGAQQYTVIGAEKLAISDDPDDIGSDFFLLRLLSDIPASYYSYYCGWDAGSGNSSSGVGIHHPNGEVKKISTYTTPLGSSGWGTTPNTHWVVKWSATPNGHGVTEGGSSGSPLFDNEKLVIGTLTGGESSCTNLTSEDMYGKFSYSWSSYGTTPVRQLKPWLDPINTSQLKLSGTFNEKLAVADFSANSVTIPVGATVDFTDLSAGKPDKWHWYFEGAEPGESTQQHPVGIRFGSYGTKNVKLVVSNSYNTDSVIKVDYIDVRAVVSPNPTRGGVISILTDTNNEGGVVVEVYDLLGKLVQRFDYRSSGSAYHIIRLPDYGNAFIVKVIQGDQVQSHKVLVIH